MKNFVRCFLLLLVIDPLTSHAAGTSVTGKVGTLGFGVEVMHYFTPVLSGRVGLNAFNYDFNEVDGDIEYDYDLELTTASFLLDWHPMENGFYLSAGLFSNQSDLNGTGRPMAGTYNIGGVDYPAAAVGELNGKIDFDSTAPYLGLGWGSAFGDSGRFSLSADIGVLFQGTPEVELTANGLAAGDPVFQENLAREEADLQDDLDEFKHYPVLSVGVSYQF